MILKRCHIENFGTLSGFDCEFTPGLTVLLRENGFGKSTLAAFIKAMFYGLQKDGNSLEKNERKRFDPWQGGKFGGFLEFSANGTDYRVTRFFGKTAAKDSFSLWNLTKGSPSTDFSEQLGESLFHLDAKSFARSTYLSQFSDSGPTATTSIQAKLTDLVEDTSDLLNFDTAMKALKDARKKLGVSQKAGSLVPNTREELLALEMELADIQSRIPELDEICRRIDEENAAAARENQALSQVWDQIRQAAQFEKQAMAYRQEQVRRQKVSDTKSAISALDARHPQGYPPLEEIELQKQHTLLLDRATAHLHSLSRPENAEIAETGRQRFPNPEQTVRELEEAQKKCTLLEKLTAQQGAQWLPQEADQLEALNHCFPNGAPGKEERAQLARNLQQLQALQVQMDAAVLSADDRLALDTLETRFSRGLPTEADLTACEQNREALRALRQKAESCRLPQEEEASYEALRRTFTSGVPNEEDIQAQQQSCRRIAQLEGRKSAKTTQVEKAPLKKAPILIGILLALAGAALFLFRLPVPGAVLLAASSISLILGLLPGAQSPRTVTTSAITQEENQELYDRKSALEDFLLRFYQDVQEPDTKLGWLLRDRDQYLRLREQQARYSGQQEALQKEILEKGQRLRAFYAAYFPGRPYDPGFVSALRQQAQALTQLRLRQDNLLARRKELEAQAAALRHQAKELLSRYGQTGTDLAEAAAALDRDSDRWEQLKEKQAAVRSAAAEIHAQAQPLEEALQALLEAYNCFTPGVPYAEQLSSLRRQLDSFRQADTALRQYEDSVAKDRQTIEAAQKNLQRFAGAWGPGTLSQLEADTRARLQLEQALVEHTQDLETFLNQNPHTECPASDLPDQDTLKRQEAQLRAQSDETGKTLSSLRENRNRLQHQVERIPALQDQMAALEESGKDALEKYSLLTGTMDLLETARENLATGYVGTVKTKFLTYADTLLQGQLDGILLDKELTLHVDAQGEPREVAAFSAGTADSLMLCMRLALVDALFPGEKPCLILDDPFVNLDDDHTKKALEILKEISKGRQVIYLVCNSSRIV